MHKQILLIILCASVIFATTPSLGVCYYPEHWPASMWESDAQRMREVGIEYVRIGEFMWEIIEPSFSQFNWTILDSVLQIFANHGLKAILGTPTATPPKWIIDKYGGDGDASQILPFDLAGKARKFGSRRHYRFSSPAYRQESVRIVTEMANRYGKHPAVAAWQIDNEFGCHDTVRSYDTQDSLPKFRAWLQHKYENSITWLNQAWGNAFWSMNYANFSSIDLPNYTVTEANPAAWLEYYRYASQETCEYNKMQYDLIKAYSPGKWITTNFMGFFFDFDHFDLAKNLDIASWDSYPLGFTDTTNFFTEQEKIQYARTGHPDVPAFHHDLYSAVSGAGQSRKPFIVMEQQPGPVNWAFHNPSPSNGMVRLWSWEAIAHGASLVSYFRWRQVPFAQEQMHAGLNRPDNTPDVAYFEAQTVKKEIDALASILSTKAAAISTVALVFDYEAVWTIQIQPQGQEFSYIQLVYAFYSTLRRLGFSIDIVKPGAKLAGYSLVVVPSLPILTSAAQFEFNNYVNAGHGKIIFGPRSGSKTENAFQIPLNLAPGYLQDLVLRNITVTRVESFRPGSPYDEKVNMNQVEYSYTTWKEWLQVDQSVKVLARFTDEEQRPAVVEAANGIAQYVAFYPTKEFLLAYLSAVTGKTPLDVNLRLRKAREGVTFAFNYDKNPISLTNVIPAGAKLLLGNDTTKILPRDVVAWLEPQQESDE